MRLGRWPFLCTHWCSWVPLCDFALLVGCPWVPFWAPLGAQGPAYLTFFGHCFLWFQKSQVREPFWCPEGSLWSPLGAHWVYFLCHCAIVTHWVPFGTISAPFGALYLAKWPPRCLLRSRGRPPFSCISHLCVGSGVLSAASAFEDGASSVPHPLFACHGGMARVPAEPYEASLLAFLRGAS